MELGAGRSPGLILASETKPPKRVSDVWVEGKGENLDESFSNRDKNHAHRSGTVGGNNNRTATSLTLNIS